MGYFLHPSLPRFVKMRPTPPCPPPDRPVCAARDPMNAFMAHSEIIDWRTPSVITQARILANGASDDELIAERCFTFVRDHIRHSRDHRIPVVTLSASSVLHHRAGYCYAKAHLLAALLRACGIPAALCYQRLQLSDTNPRFILHGLNAVFLKRHGWYRLDARGNKPGVDAQFCPPAERLAFHPEDPGERDLPGLFAEPLGSIVSVLSQGANEDAVYRTLPDVDDEPSINRMAEQAVAPNRSLPPCLISTSSVRGSEDS